MSSHQPEQKRLQAAGAVIARRRGKSPGRAEAVDEAMAVEERCPASGRQRPSQPVQQIRAISEHSEESKTLLVDRRRDHARSRRSIEEQSEVAVVSKTEMIRRHWRRPGWQTFASEKHRGGVQQLGQQSAPHVGCCRGQPEEQPTRSCSRRQLPPVVAGAVDVEAATVNRPDRCAEQQMRCRHRRSRSRRRPRSIRSAIWVVAVPHRNG